MRKRLKDLYTAVLSDAEYLQELVELGVLIGSHRTALGINQEEFAKMIGVSRRTMCTSQQILDTNHKKIYNKKLSVSQISVRNATCDIELASDSLTNKLDAVH